MSTKMMRASRYFWSVSDHTYQSRLGDPGWRASWNQGCWSEVWFITMSAITRRPRAWAASRKS